MKDISEDIEKNEEEINSMNKKKKKKTNDNDRK